MKNNKIESESNLGWFVEARENTAKAILMMHELKISEEESERLFAEYEDSKELVKYLENYKSNNK